MVTTPKPMTAPDETAARLREAIEYLISEWRRYADDAHGECADELEVALNAAPPPEALTPKEWNKVRGIFALAEAHGVECAELWTKLRHPVVDTEGLERERATLSSGPEGRPTPDLGPDQSSPESIAPWQPIETAPRRCTQARWHMASMADDVVDTEGK